MTRSKVNCKVPGGEEKVKDSEMYFIGVNTQLLDSESLFPLLDRLKSISGKNIVYVVLSEAHAPQLTELREYARSSRNINFQLSPALTELSNGTMGNTLMPAVVYSLSGNFLLSDLPYFLLIDNLRLPPTSLLKKFDRAISYLEETDPNWGVLGGLYHRNLECQINMDDSKLPVLWGCSVYKRVVIEIQSRMLLAGGVGSVSTPILSGRERKFNCYYGHEQKKQSEKLISTRPQIVKAAQMSVWS